MSPLPARVRVRPHWRAGLAALALAWCSACPAEPDPAPVARGALDEARIARWRSALSEQRSAEVAAEGPALVGPAGALARDGEALALVARALHAQGDSPAAARLLEAARVPEAERGWVEVERARILLEQGDLAGVERLLAPEPGSAAPVRHPDFPEAWMLRARALERAGSGPAAAQLAQEFLRRLPTHSDAPVAWHLLAEQAQAAGDEAAATQLREREAGARRWQEAHHARSLQVARNPGEPLPRLGLAVLWFEAGDVPRARAQLLELTARCPDFGRGWYHLGEAERLLGRAAPAHAAYTRALECDPQDTRSRFNRALLSWLGGRAEEARLDFESLVGTPAELEPAYGELHLHLARIAQAQGRQRESQASYARYRALGGTAALELRPTSAPAADASPDASPDAR
jgi:tetratricopeptide (TPR) repeat protein